VAALDLAVVAGRVGTDEFVVNTELGGGFLEKSLQIALAAGKSVGELKAVIRLNTLDLHAFPCEPRSHLFEKISGGIGACPTCIVLLQVVGGVEYEKHLWLHLQGV
jgi:hypothetical protein